MLTCLRDMQTMHSKLYKALRVLRSRKYHNIYHIPKIIHYKITKKPSKVLSHMQYKREEQFPDFSFCCYFTVNKQGHHKPAEGTDNKKTCEIINST